MLSKLSGFLIAILFTLSPITSLAQSFDDFGGLKTVAGSGHPHAQSATCSQSGTTQTCTVTDGTKFWNPERILLLNCVNSTLNYVYASDYDQGASHITNISSNTITMTSDTSSQTVGNTSCTFSPAKFFIQTSNGGAGSGPKLFTPENNWLSVIAMADLCAINNGAACNLSKYGTQNAGCTAEFNQYLSWNFNTVANLSAIVPTRNGNCGANGTKPPFMDEAHILENSTVNRFGYATQSGIDLVVGTDTHWNSVTGVCAFVSRHMGDIFNPYYQTFVTGEMGDSSNQNNAAYPGFVGFLTDDNSSQMGEIFGNNANFHSVFPDTHRQDCDGALLGMVTSPMQTGNNAPLRSGVGPSFFPDPQVYSKIPMPAPPGACDTTSNPCSLSTLASKTYSATIGTLNTAWGTSYSTFGSSGKCVGWNYTWCGSTAGVETYGTGDGVTTTFAHTLANNASVSPFSVMVLLSGVPLAFDCPNYSQTGCSPGVGKGSLITEGSWLALQAYAHNTVIDDSNGCLEQMTTAGTPAGTSAGSAPAWAATPCTNGTTTTDNGMTWTRIGPALTSGNCTYSTGDCTVTFSSAPPNAMAITVNYIQNGWPCLGTGLLDECGATASIGTNAFCLLAIPAWQSTHAYTAADEVYDSSSGTWQFAMTTGTTGGSLPTFSLTRGTKLTDGGVLWESLGRPICGSEGGSDHPAANMQQTLAAFLENVYQPQLALKYYQINGDTWHTNYPDTFYGGVDISGNDNPMRSQVLQMANNKNDWIMFIPFDATLDANADAKIVFTTRYYTKPIIGGTYFYTSHQNQASSGSCCNTVPVFSNLTTMAQGWYAVENFLMKTPGYNGVFSFNGGIVWGSSHNFSGCNTCGLKDNLDNAYDGVENVVASVPCSPPNAAFTCGGETPGGAWVGQNAIFGAGLIKAANSLWFGNAPLGAPGTTVPPGVKVTSGVTFK